MNGKTTIKIEGQDVPLRFAYPCIKWFAEACAESEFMFTPGEDANFTTDGFGKLLHCAYKNAMLVKEEEAVLTYEHFFDWVSEQQDTEEGQKIMAEVLKVYADSSVMKKLVNATEEKKSPVIPMSQTSTSTSSSPSATESLDGDPGNSTAAASAM